MLKGFKKIVFMGALLLFGAQFANAEQIRVLGAASLKYVLEDIKNEFKNAGKVVF